MENNRKNSLLIFLSFVIDVAIVYFCFEISDKISTYFSSTYESGYRVLAAFECLTVFFFYMYELYAKKENTRESTFISIILTAIASSILVFLISIVFKWREYTLSFGISMLVSMILLLEIWRLVFSLAVAKFRDKKTILILESKNVTSRLARKIKYSCTNLNMAWYHIIDEDDSESVDYVLNNMIEKFDVIFISQALSDKLKDRIFEKAISLQKGVDVLATIDRVIALKGSVRQFGDTPVIEGVHIGLTKSQGFFKRLFDIAFSVAAIIAASPIFLICAVAIKLDSPGPVLYKQERYTINKKVFNCYKFRTMVVDAEKDGAQLSSKNDPRITNVGKIIRALRLDELPQLFNILLGSMSVVGPRPERPIFADEYCVKVKNYQLRYFFKAGLTGYAQVYGKYNTRASDKILMDMIYAACYSFWLDIKIILLTVRTMFIHSSTDGVDDESERALDTYEREQERIRRSYAHKDGNDDEKHIDNRAGV